MADNNDLKIIIDIDALTIADALMLSEVEGKSVAAAIKSMLMLCGRVIKIDGVPDDEARATIEAMPVRRLGEITEAVIQGVSSAVNPEDEAGKNS